MQRLVSCLKRAHGARFTRKNAFNMHIIERAAVQALHPLLSTAFQPAKWHNPPDQQAVRHCQLHPPSAPPPFRHRPPLTSDVHRGQTRRSSACWRSAQTACAGRPAASSTPSATPDRPPGFSLSDRTCAPLSGQRTAGGPTPAARGSVRARQQTQTAGAARCHCGTAAARQRSASPQCTAPAAPQPARANHRGGCSTAADGESIHSDGWESCQQDFTSTARGAQCNLAQYKTHHTAIFCHKQPVWLTIAMGGSGLSTSLQQQSPAR